MRENENEKNERDERDEKWERWEKLEKKIQIKIWEQRLSRTQGN